MGSYTPAGSLCPEDRVWQGEERSFFLRIAALTGFPRETSICLRWEEFFESPVSLAVQNFHQLSPHQSLTLMDIREGFTTNLYGRRTELT